MQVKTGSGRQGNKKPYQKPELVSFELFERRSLTCTSQWIHSLSIHTPGCSQSFS